MTAQVMDTCTWQGETWFVCEWEAAGEATEIPSAEAFGFETRAPHTANWRGYVCHFRIAEASLVLVRMTVYPADGYESHVPNVAQRSERTLALSDITEVELTFDSYAVGFTGTLYLGRDLDWLRYEHMGTQALRAFRKRATLRFEQGRLVEATREEDEPPTPGIAAETI